MEVKHCGNVLQPYTRTIKPTVDEMARGVIELDTFEFQCRDKSCLKRLFYKQEVFATGYGEWARIRPHQRASFLKRLRLAKHSDSVQGTFMDRNAGKWRFKTNIRVQ